MRWGPANADADSILAGAQMGELAVGGAKSFNEGVDAAIRFVLDGRFLHDEAPAAQFAREVAANLPRIKRNIPSPPSGEQAGPSSEPIEEMLNRAYDNWYTEASQKADAEMAVEVQDPKGEV